MSDLIQLLDELPDDYSHELPDSGLLEPSEELINACFIEMLEALLES